MSISKLTALAAWALVSLSTVSCTSTIYRPSEVMFVSNPERLDEIRKEIEITSGDGTQLGAWWLPSRSKQPSKGVVVQFHGNAENITSHFASLLWLTDQGYDLLTFDYRGYGISQGTPSQEGLDLDAQAAIRHAIALKPAPATITLYGQSLGGAVLLHAIAGLTPEERSRIRAVIIEGSFHSYRSIARDVLSRSWLTVLIQHLAYVLVSDSTSPEKTIAQVSPIPLLVVHGDRDPVIPVAFGRKIFERAREPKRFFLIPGGEHLYAPAESAAALRQEILGFIAQPPR